MKAWLSLSRMLWVNTRGGKWHGALRLSFLGPRRHRISYSPAAAAPLVNTSFDTCFQSFREHYHLVLVNVHQEIEMVIELEVV